MIIMNPPELQNPKMNSLDLSRPNQQKKKAKTHQQKNHQKEKNTN